jgi:hypothetical protein
MIAQKPGPLVERDPGDLHDQVLDEERHPGQRRVW